MNIKHFARSNAQVDSQFLRIDPFDINRERSQLFQQASATGGGLEDNFTACYVVNLFIAGFVSTVRAAGWVDREFPVENDGIACVILL